MALLSWRTSYLRLSLSEMSQISSLLVKGLCLLTLVTLCSASVCTSQQPAIAAPYKNIWSGLTDDEAIAVIKLLLDRSSGLNLTAEEDAGR